MRYGSLKTRKLPLPLRISYQNRVKSAAWDIFIKIFQPNLPSDFDSTLRGRLRTPVHSRTFPIQALTPDSSSGIPDYVRAFKETGANSRAEIYDVDSSTPYKSHLTKPLAKS